ncbi:MAG: carbohydrate porin, partial [Mariprofundaceae bacterium]|nr:carbohydrate porin [Mariprofundaceae bacterium]
MNKHTGRVLLSGLLLASLLSPVPSHAEESGLAGDWGGMKDQFAASGLSLDAVYTGEFVRNLSPGLVNGRKQTVYQNAVDLAATLDSGEAGLWQGGVFYVSGLFFNGGLPTANVIGDLQTVSNIEAAGYQFSLFEVWYEQQLANSGLSLLVGLHDLNAEFYVSEYGSLLINSSFGLGADMGANVAVSTFPKASWAARAKYTRGDAWYVQAGMYDGDPATKNMNATEGYLSAFEAGLATGEGTVKLGAWHHTADRTVAGRSFGSDYGLYGLTDQPLIEFAGMQLGGFAQFGWAPKQRNDIVRYLGAGLHL